MDNLRRLLFSAVACSALANSALAVDYDRPPINYSQSTPDNCISRLQQQIDQGKVALAHDGHLGYLPALLKSLGVNESSQTLVYSKTSFQRHRISPETPRALYFNDDVYIGFCQLGEVLEISAVDAQLGAVFYSLSQDDTDKPQFVRQNDNCLLCHAGSHTQGYPGHIVRSVYVDAAGQPVLAMGTHRVDQSLPIKQRWGGWYVTGSHGDQQHLGNLIVRGGTRRPEEIDNRSGLNVTDLRDRFDTQNYLTPHSDLVALMVLEHQVEMHNLLTRASMQTQQALYDESLLNRELKRPADYRSESTTSRIRAACEPLVKYMLCHEEAELTAPLRGSTPFARQFAERGPRDRLGRSLRELDLERRLFKYPCSYLIYSSSFDALPAVAREYIWRRLGEVLSGQDMSREFAHLALGDRRAIREILRDTKDIPAQWPQ